MINVKRIRKTRDRQERREMTADNDVCDVVDCCRKHGALAGQGRVRGECQRTFVILMTGTTACSSEMGVPLRGQSLTNCLVIIVGAGKYHAAGLHDPDNPEEKPARQ